VFEVAQAFVEWSALVVVGGLWTKPRKRASKSGIAVSLRRRQRHRLNCLLQNGTRPQLLFEQLFVFECLPCSQLGA